MPLGGHLRLSKAATARVAAAEMGLATAELRELAQPEGPDGDDCGPNDGRPRADHRRR